MTDWLGTFLDICERRGDLLFQPLPAWVWTRDGTAVCWANPAGADILGFLNFERLGQVRAAGDLQYLRGNPPGLTRRAGAEGDRFRSFRVV